MWTLALGSAIFLGGCGEGHIISTTGTTIDEPVVTDRRTECTAITCSNGGVCINEINGHTCDCAGIGYEGQNCETPTVNCKSGDATCPVGSVYATDTDCQCGNGTRQTTEACDDRNNGSTAEAEAEAEAEVAVAVEVEAGAGAGAGCSASCQTETGLTCPVPATSCVGHAFTVFDYSYYGSGAICDDGLTSCDLTARVPRPLPLENRSLPLISLPPDSTGWNVITMEAPDGCGVAGVQTISAAIAAHVLGETPTLLVLPPCVIDVVPTGNSKVGFSIPNHLGDYFWIKGHASGTSILNMTWLNNESSQPIPPTDGYRYRMFVIGNNGVQPGIAAWTWDSGFSRGDSIVQSTGGSVNELYAGDLIRLKVDPWNDRTNKVYSFHRVTCSKWSDGTVAPTAHVTCSSLPAGTIKLTGDLQHDMLGESHTNGPFAGHEIHHIERKGGGALTDNYVEYFGMSGFKITNANESPTVDSFNPALQIHNCQDCWVNDMDFTVPWGTQWIAVSTTSGNLLVAGNNFENPLLRQRCRIDIQSVAAASDTDNRVRMTVQSNDCRDWNAGFEKFIWFPTSIGEASLKNALVEFTCISGCSQGSHVTVLDLTAEYHTDTPITFNNLSEGWRDTPQGDWGMQINNWGIGALYIKNAGSQVVNNSFHNTRVGVVFQSGGTDNVLAYNTFIVDPDHDCSRSWFMHGGAATSLLWEGNDANCGAAIVATSPNGLGIGPNMTVMNNRLLAQGRVETHARGDQCGLSASLHEESGHSSGIVGFCNESTGQDGYSSEDNNFLGNILEGVSTNRPIASCDHDDEGGAGCESPYQQLNPVFHKNVWI
jgi:hypothetical protein